MPYFVFE